MRDPVDCERVRACLRALGEQLRSPTVVYLTGGASAVLEGWRESTMDLDLKFVPDAEAFGVLAELKERLRINIELASPDQFLPPLRGWEGRSPSIDRIGRVEFRHFDFRCQALRIPRQSGHLFHGKATTCSTGIRPPVPRESDHLSRGSRALAGGR